MAKSPYVKFIKLMVFSERCEIRHRSIYIDIQHKLQLFGRTVVIENQLCGGGKLFYSVRVEHQ